MHRLSNVAYLAALWQLTATLVEAKCSHDIAERGLAEHLARQEALARMNRMKRQATSSTMNVITEAQILDPTEECAPYYYEPVNSVFSQYPAIWQIASIVSGDTEAQNAYNAIVNDPNFPNLTVKGTPQGDFSASANYSATDPDCWWSWSHCDTPKHASLPADVTTCPEPYTWGLTFDDGPNCTHNAFYNYLASNQYQATMFYIGSNVMDHPLQAQRGLADGHQIGVHTWSHRYATGLTNEQFFAELWYSRKAIKHVLGVTPLVWRAPYGDVDDRIRFIAHAMNLTTIMWNHDTDDWKIISNNNPSGLPTASIVANYEVAENASSSTGGSIVLTHELNSDTMDLAMAQLPIIAKDYKHIMPVAVCQNMTQPYVETSYVYPNFAQFVSGQNKTTNVTGSSTQTLFTPTSAPSSTGSSPGAGSTVSAAGMPNYAQGDKSSSSGSSSLPTSKGSTSAARRSASLPFGLSALRALLG